MIVDAKRIGIDIKYNVAATLSCVDDSNCMAEDSFLRAIA